MANAAHPILNGVRDMMLTPEAIRERNNIKTKLELVKIASVVAIVACLIIFFAVPKVLMLLLLLPIAYIAYEIGTVAGNCHEVIDKFAVELIARWNEANFVKQATKYAPLSRAIGNLILDEAQKAQRERR